MPNPKETSLADLPYTSGVMVITNILEDTGSAFGVLLADGEGVYIAKSMVRPGMKTGDVFKTIVTKNITRPDKTRWFAFTIGEATEDASHAAIMTQTLTLLGDGGVWTSAQMQASLRRLTGREYHTTLLEEILRSLHRLGKCHKFVHLGPGEREPLRSWFTVSGMEADVDLFEGDAE